MASRNLGAHYAWSSAKLRPPHDHDLHDLPTIPLRETNDSDGHYRVSAHPDYKSSEHDRAVRHPAMADHHHNRTMPVRRHDREEPDNDHDRATPNEKSDSDHAPREEYTVRVQVTRTIVETNAVTRTPTCRKRMRPPVVWTTTTTTTEEREYTDTIVAGTVEIVDDEIRHVL